MWHRLIYINSFSLACLSSYLCIFVYVRQLDVMKMCQDLWYSSDGCWNASSFCGVNKLNHLQKLCQMLGIFFFFAFSVVISLFYYYCSLRFEIKFMHLFSYLLDFWFDLSDLCAICLHVCVRVYVVHAELIYTYLSHNTSINVFIVCSVSLQNMIRTSLCRINSSSSSLPRTDDKYRIWTHSLLHIRRWFCGNEFHCEWSFGTGPDYRTQFESVDAVQDVASWISHPKAPQKQAKKPKWYFKKKWITLVTALA